MPFNDDIDLDGIDMGEVCGVVNVPPEPILGDSPIDDVPVKRKPTILESRNPDVDVRHWSGAPDYVLTLVACIERSKNVRFSRKALSDCIAEQMSVKRVDKVKVYLRHQPLMNLQIHTLHHCGFARNHTELVWERDMTLRPEPKPAPPVERSEPERWDSWREEIKAAKERQSFCASHHIVFKQAEIDRIALLESLIRDAEENRKTVQASPEYRALEAQQRAIQVELDKMTGKS